MLVDMSTSTCQLVGRLISARDLNIEALRLEQLLGRPWKDQVHKYVAQRVGKGGLHQTCPVIMREAIDMSIYVSILTPWGAVRVKLGR